MLELPHTIVGAAIATKITHPLLSSPLILLSHFLLDLIPHWNPNLYSETKKYHHPTPVSTRIVFIDVFLSLIAGFSLAFRFWPNLLRVFLLILGCFLAVLPDVIEGPYFFLGFRPQFLEKFIQFQRRYQGKAPLVPGIIIQGLVIVLGMAIALS